MIVMRLWHQGTLHCTRYAIARMLGKASCLSLPQIPAQADTGCILQGAPAAHRGFLSRARAADAGRYLREAQRRGLRLVLCGAPATWT